MKSLLAAAFVLAIGLGVASAQTAAPTAPAAPATTMTPAPDAPAKPVTGKDVRAQCRAEAKAQGLKGDSRKAAVQQCFAQARPDLVKAKQCRDEAKAKSLTGPDFRAYVKQCKAAG